MKISAAPAESRSSASMSVCSARCNLNSPPNLERKWWKSFPAARSTRVYILYNEFKSVIAQRLIVQKLLPIKEIGVEDVRMAEEAKDDERKRRIEAAKTAGVGMRPMIQARPTRLPRNSARRPWITFTNSLPAQLFREIFCRSISASRFFMRRWNPWRPNTPPA